MGTLLVGGGFLGTLVGAALFHWLQMLGQIDTVIGLLYVVLLGWIGTLMARDSVRSILAQRSGRAPQARQRRHHPLVASLPMRWRFYRSGLYISPLAPFILGIMTGILTMLLGVGGAFIMVPAMLYLLGMPTQVVVGTSLYQTLFITMTSIMVHSLTTKAVDLVLAVLLLVGSVAGAQVGIRIANRARPDKLRIILAVIVLTVAIRMALGLGWRPDEIYTVTVQ